MWRILWFLAVIVGVLLLLKAFVIAAFVAAMLPVVLGLRLWAWFTVPQQRVPLVDPLDGFKPIRK
jgi:hypothetical protein